MVGSADVNRYLFCTKCVILEVAVYIHVIFACESSTDIGRIKSYTNVVGGVGGASINTSVLFASYDLVSAKMGLGWTEACLQTSFLQVSSILRMDRHFGYHEIALKSAGCIMFDHF